MSQYQLIAFDMDGTLLNSNKQISPETLNAIKRATDAGKTVILCTGRNLAELNAFTEIIPGLRYLDCVSGACVYDLKEKKTLYSQALDPGIVKKADGIWHGRRSHDPCTFRAFHCPEGSAVPYG